MTKTIRVIGVGSPVVGDDMGMQLVEQLRDDALWQGREEIEWLALERPGATLMQYFYGVETLCLIDALDSAEHSGVVRIEPEELLAETGTFSSHQFGIAETLQLACALNQLPPRLLLYGIVPTHGCYAELKAMLLRDLAS